MVPEERDQSQVTVLQREEVGEMLIGDLGPGTACCFLLSCKAPFPVGQKDKGSRREGSVLAAHTQQRESWQEKERSHRCSYSISQGY